MIARIAAFSDFAAWAWLCIGDLFLLRLRKAKPEVSIVRRRAGRLAALAFVLKITAFVLARDRRRPRRLDASERAANSRS
jgi:hypothetical protein